MSIICSSSFFCKRQYWSWAPQGLSANSTISSSLLLPRLSGSWTLIAFLPSESFPETKTQSHLPFSVLGTLEGLPHLHLSQSPPDSLKRRHKLILRTEQAVTTFLLLSSRLQLQPGSSHSIRHQLSCLCWALNHSWWRCFFKRDLREVF